MLVLISKRDPRYKFTVTPERLALETATRAIDAIGHSYALRGFNFQPFGHFYAAPCGSVMDFRKGLVIGARESAEICCN